jgi:prolyl-tRNA synthetase
LPALQPPELWKLTGRYDALGEVLIKFTDRHKKECVLGPTHEEVITSLVAGEVKSYKQLPVILYQIQTKFRDEPRPRFGVLRSKEFIMKDAYSFDMNTEGLNKNYKKMYDAYCAIFSRCGLDYLPVEADTGFMGGDVSHEFMIPSETGEDAIILCQSCGYAASKEIIMKGPKSGENTCPKCGGAIQVKFAIEVGHTFKLGAKYSGVLGATYLDEKGKENPMVMGCYGIGVNRIAAAAIEQNNDKDGIIWPAGIAPFQVVIIPVNSTDEKIRDFAERVYEDLNSKGIEALLDDRDERAGIKFKDADLIGFPFQVIVSDRHIAEGKVEIKNRRTSERKIVKKQDIVGNRLA